MTGAWTLISQEGDYPSCHIQKKNEKADLDKYRLRENNARGVYIRLVTL